MFRIRINSHFPADIIVCICIVLYILEYTVENELLLHLIYIIARLSSHHYHKTR